LKLTGDDLSASKSTAKVQALNTNRKGFPNFSMPSIPVASIAVECKALNVRDRVEV
jgi:hypothetical protein